ncbi:MAG: hypothetical protein HQ494_05270 [Rhodospirillales bacterium]|nr:hypothetical protein [Rhodospirillales bacterium]
MSASGKDNATGAERRRGTHLDTPTSFARRGVMAPAGLWERGSEASGISLPSGRSFALSEAAAPPKPDRAPKALTISPSGETNLSARFGAAPLEKSANSVSKLPEKPETLGPQDKCGWLSRPGEITGRQIDEKLIGREIARDQWIDGQTRARQLREQSEDIARRLEGQGITMRQDREITMVGLVTGLAERSTDFRNCNLIPQMQSRNMHDMMKHVRFVFDTTRPGQLRMLVVSGGWVPLEDYREYHRAHCRRISKMAALPALRAAGVEALYYNVENTIQRGDDGRVMLNLHSHILIRSSRRLGKKKWRAFMDRLRLHFPKGYVHDSPIREPAEVVKYVFKPSEFKALSDGELAELFWQMHGRPAEETGKDRGEGPLKFFHPLGSMRRFRQSLKAERRKLVLVPTQDDRWVWRMTEKKEPKPVEASSAPPQKNMLLAITSPSPRFGPKMEPVLVVQDYTGDLEAVIRQANIEDRAAFARILFNRPRKPDQARRDSASMKHTTTTTVPNHAGPEAWKLYPPPDRAGQSLPGGMLQ